MHSSTAALGPAVGSVVGGHFRIEAALGSGGMGDVFRVVDERTGRRLALKRQARRRTGTSQAAQFEREYHTLCQLAHPRIIEVYEYGVDPDGAFYTMELLDGQDLRERGQLGWREACALLLDVASSLAILHARGLLHRDLSPRNVRCTSDGRAKLIDFGAMTPMGMPKTIVGTPPFIAPETLQLQTLDARVDLYGLGALAYVMLTGQVAFCARRVDDLRSLWMTPPLPVVRLVPDVPEALDRLVMELMQLDRMARPATAAEVMERLSGIAGLPPAERAEVTRAYLVTPPLIGREALLREVHARLVSATHDRGGCVLITGAAGSGRSRCLDACVLEAKLLGAVVLRSDATERAGGDHSLAGSLARQLWQAIPQAETSAAAWRSELAALVPELDPERAPEAAPPERQVLQGALRDWFLSASRSRLLVIAVDDFDAIDKPSAAFLALLAHQAERHGVALLLTAESDAPSTPPLEFVRSLALLIALQPFSVEQTEALLQAVFGAGQSASLARRIHERSDGSPRGVMGLCEWLVDRKIARYEAGSWALPRVLSPGDLPESLVAALHARVAGLSDDARELAEVLCLSDPELLVSDGYPVLTEHGDHARTYRALDGLVAAGILLWSGERYRFRMPELPELLASGVSDERRRTLHGRIARALEAGDEPIAHLHHLFLAGQERTAIDRLLSLKADPRIESSALALTLVDAAAQAAQRLSLAPRVQFALCAWVVALAAGFGEYALFVRYSVPLIEALERDSGLLDFRELAAVPESARLTQALTRVQQRYDATPEADRGMAPFDAIGALARVSAACVGMAQLAQDYDLLQRLPSLTPLAPLAPALAVVQRLVEAADDFQAGRYVSSQGGVLEVLARMEQPDHGGLDPARYKVQHLAMQYWQGVLQTAWGIPSAPEWLAELETAPGHRANAFRVHMTSELMQGNVEAARVCQRRAELLELEDFGYLRYVGTTARIELLAYAWSDDLLGVKRSLERIEEVATRFPRWQADVHIARFHYKRLQGDHAGALDAILPAMQLTAPGRHLSWTIAAAAHVHALTDDGRTGEAAERGLAYLELHEHARLSGMTSDLMQSVAEALIALGRLDEAVSLADRCIADDQQRGTRGLVLGRRFETRARVALAADDAGGFQQFADRCAKEYKIGHNRALTARYKRLMRAADDRQWALQDRAAGLGAAGGRADPPVRHPEAERLASYSKPSQRFEHALARLLEAAGATAGHLFGVRAGTLELLSSAHAPEPSSRLREDLEDYMQRQLDSSDLITSNAARASTAVSTYQDGGRSFEPILLLGRHEGQRVITAVAALERGQSPRTLDPELLSAVATALLHHDDVDPIAIVA